MYRHYLYMTIAAVFFTAVWAEADNLKQLSDAAFDELEIVIGQLETRTDAPAIQQEIEDARRQIVHGKLLLRAGRTKKAAEYAERLQVQVELIRALVSAAEAVHEHDAVQREILDMESKLQVLRYRLNRLRLEMASDNIEGDAPSAHGNKEE